jgi:hypothetical protein
MSNVDFMLVRREIKEAARRAFSGVRSQHPDETFYAFALCSDDSAMTVCPVANTEAAYRRCVARYASYSPPVDAHYLRWGTVEWAYESAGQEYFDQVQNLINVEGRYEERDPDGFVRFKGRVFASMILGLKDLDEEGAFGVGEERKEITLFCSVSDSGCAVWMEDESARRLNPPLVYRAFSEQWSTYMAAELSANLASPGRVHAECMRFLDCR